MGRVHRQKTSQRSTALLSGTLRHCKIARTSVHKTHAAKRFSLRPVAFHRIGILRAPKTNGATAFCTTRANLRVMEQRRWPPHCTLSKLAKLASWIEARRLVLPAQASLQPEM